eukprot:TRINITY_DN58155_c0_g1_i1.p1 TRINITY_DN58155_c0_g1~~TRINITY_DN58155_c0_g1_i1.p1  ORF type:complete len:254 (-),score=26.79 TRINITY_DN58155_c0_g1_i1:441-1202(-)
MKTLYVAWKDSANTRAWFPVGMLEAEVGGERYRFRYTAGATHAARQCGFKPFDSFPEFDGDYSSSELFPFFANRVQNAQRPGLKSYLERLDLHGPYDPLEMLAMSEGRRATDTLEVFPKVERAGDGTFAMKFFLHGWRHIHPLAEERITALQPGERLGLSVEVTNPVTVYAIQIHTKDNLPIGWAPRYLFDDLWAVISRGGCSVDAQVGRVNAPPSPPSQRVVVTFRGCWPEGYEPMSGEQFRPLADKLAAVA